MKFLCDDKFGWSGRNTLSQTGVAKSQVATPTTFNLHSFIIIQKPILERHADHYLDACRILLSSNDLLKPSAITSETFATAIPETCM